MFCDQCGTALQDGQRFCHSCGKSFAASAPPRPATPPRSSARGRVAAHAGILGALWVGWSILHLFPALLGTFLGWTGFPWLMHHGTGFIRPVFFGQAIGTLSGIALVCAIGGIAAGVALIGYKPWARVLLLILAFLSLLSIPFGTAIGIYTLWVLLPRESEDELIRISATR